MTITISYGAFYLALSGSATFGLLIGCILAASKRGERS